MKYLIALIGVILVALSIANSVDAVQPEAQVCASWRHSLVYC